MKVEGNKSLTKKFGVVKADTSVDMISHDNEWKQVFFSYLIYLCYF